jgi:hypothetical protein
MYVHLSSKTSKRKMAARELLSEVAGGATRMPSVQGAWFNRDTGVLIIEEVTLVYSFVDGDGR